MKIRGLIATVALALGGYGPIAGAAPATLHIGSGYGTTCATGGCPIYGNEVNNIGTPVPGTPYTGAMDIYQTSGGEKGLDDLLLIFGVANDTSGTMLDGNSLSNLSLIDSATKTPIHFTFSGYQGSMVSGEEIYSFLANTALNQSYSALSGMNNSNSFSNWAAADLAVDKIDVSNFGIYVFDLNLTDYGVSFGAKNFIDIALRGIPEGTFAAAYGQSDNKTYGTPFTESGLVDQPPPDTAVPEPGSLLIFAFGLALLAIGRTVSARGLRRG